MRKTGIRLSACLSVIICINILLSAAICFLPLKGVVLGVAMVCMFMLQSSMQPSMNSLHRGYELQGLQVNFGFARGMGSVSFAVVTFLAGQLLKIIHPDTLPALYLALQFVLLGCIYSFRKSCQNGWQASAEQRMARGICGGWFSSRWRGLCRNFCCAVKKE